MNVILSIILSFFFNILSEVIHTYMCVYMYVYVCLCVLQYYQGCNVYHKLEFNYFQDQFYTILLKFLQAFFTK